MSLNQRAPNSDGGWLMIDNRGTPGTPESLATAAGLPPNAGIGLFEAATYTCTHCQSVVVMNPERKRDRAYCRGCDHSICDNCGAAKAAGAKCRTFKQVVDEILEAAEQAETFSSILLAP